MKRIAIVGAGPCGLVALKEMLEAGHDAFICEHSATFGGVFASAAIYTDLHLTISNWLMAFSDFPDPQRLCYASAEDYMLYLENYVRHFGLNKYIRYNTEVFSASIADDGNWLLEVRQKSEGSVQIIQADALIVATGAHQEPKCVPSRLEGFEGRMLHSSEYDQKFKQSVADKRMRVLVVGGGESAADVSAELGELSPNVTVWTRRPLCVGPRYLTPDDEVLQMKANKSQDFPANSFLEAASTSRMGAAQNAYVYGLFRRILWNMPSFLNSTLAKMCLESTKCAPLVNDQSQYITKNQRMCEAVHRGKVDLVVASKASACGRTVEFTMQNGDTIHRDFDAIVLCTGYTTSFAWLNLDHFDASPRMWWSHCFPPGLGHKLAFVGYARPHQGGVTALAEILSRYIAMVWSGDRQLPADYAAQARRDEAAEREYYFLTPDLSTLVDYNAFMESVARRVGCEPRLPLACIVTFDLHMLALLSLLLGSISPIMMNPTVQVSFLIWLATLALFLLMEGGVLIKWWYYPHWPVWFRQRGPHANRNLLLQTLARVPLWKSTEINRGFVLMIVWSWPNFYIQRLLSLLVFVPHSLLVLLGRRFPKAYGGLLRPRLYALHNTEWRVSDLFHP